MGDQSVMQTVTHVMNTERDEALFSTLPQTAFIMLLARAIANAAREFARSPFSYLRFALLPRRIKDWLPVRFATSVLTFISHPLSFVAGLFRFDRIPVGFINPTSARSISFLTNAYSVPEAGRRRRNAFVPVLVAVASVHAVFIGLLVYVAVTNLFAPYINFKIVKRPYKPFDSAVVAQLYAPQRKLESSNTEKVSTLEEIQAREQKRREEIERRKREEAERKKLEQEKAEREKAEREKAEQQAQAKAENPDKPANADADLNKYGEINETAIKDLVGKIYAMYKSGGIELNDFSVMARFSIDQDGSLPRSSINIVKSSGDPKKDDYALQILWLIGESHALRPLSPLKSNSVRFDLQNDIARLTITGFGPNPEWVDRTASSLRALFWIMSKAQKTSEAAELLSLVKINTMNNRIDLDLTVSRARASEMMRSQYANKQ